MFEFGSSTVEALGRFSTLWLANEKIETIVSNGEEINEANS